MREGLVVLGLVAISLVALRSPFIGMLAILLAMVLRDTMIVETYGYFFHYHGYEVLYIATIVSVVLAHPDRLGDFSPRVLADWGMLGFLAAMVISAMVNGVPVFGQKHIDLFFKATVLYFLLSRLVDTPRRVVCVSICLIASTTYLTYLAWSKYRAGDVVWARPYLISSHHEFALLLVITLPMIGAMLAYKMWFPLRMALFGLIPVYVLVALRTNSRSAMVGVGFGLAMLAWFNRRRWYMVLPAVPLVAFAIMHQSEDVTARVTSIWTLEDQTGEKDGSIQMRFEQMRTAKTVIASNPLFGIGPRQFFARYQDFVKDQSLVVGGSYTMHSVPLLILCEEGIVGGIAFAMIVLGSLLSAWYAVRMTRGDPAMELVGIVSAGALMGFLAWIALALARSGMWAAHIYATVALAVACCRVVEVHLAATAAEQREARGVVAPWLPGPAPAETEIVFS